MDKQTNPKPLDEEKKITDSESSENLNQKAEIDTMEAETEVVEEVKETETLSTSEETVSNQKEQFLLMNSLILQITLWETMLKF